jgi:nucleoside-diphosphate-sugar epimerase
LKLLVFGGTRFIGLNIVLAFADYDVELTIVSRQFVDMPKGVHIYTMGREEFLSVQNQVKYDLVIDFISYDDFTLSEALNKIKFKRYLLISSAWLPWLWGGRDASEFNRDFNPDKANLNPDTKRYLIGKWRAEMTAMDFSQKGQQVAIIRLPPVLGIGDHTGRTSFYSERVFDDWPMLVPENLDSNIQFVSVEVLTPILVDWMLFFDFKESMIWNAVPNVEVSYKGFLDDLFVGAKGVEPKFEIIYEDDNFYKKYINLEPLIRTPCFVSGERNIFELSKKKVAPYLSLRNNKNTSVSSTRKLEIEYFQEKKLET